MEGTRHKWPDLLLKYLTDTLSQDEWKEFERQLAASAIKRAELDVYTNYSPTEASTANELHFDKMAEWEKFAAGIEQLRVKRLPFYRQPVFGRRVAAVIVGILAIGAYQLIIRPQKKQPCRPCEAAIAAARSKRVACDTCVYLLSADGMQWSLTAPRMAQPLPPSWQLTGEPSSISYMGDPQRHYVIDNRGRESYTVKLADGSNVILRGGSQLEVPATFSRTQRNVTLHGEGFFAIITDRAHPFTVLTPGGVRATVTGTRFDLAAYRDTATRVTLLEGKVAVSWKDQRIDLHPGEQAIVDSASGISRKKLPTAALREESDWSSDIFEYHNMDIKDVIQELARQYRMTTHFDGDITEKARISAICSKNKQKLRGILANLNTYARSIRFEIDSSRITIITDKKRHK